ncbi:MAG TPA: DUF6232 family protein [Chloroflexia bacterium]|jgi:hypothetical protein
MMDANIQVTESDIQILGETFKVEDIRTVDTQAKLSPRIIFCSRLTGVFWGFLLLLLVGGFILSDDSNNQELPYLSLCLVIAVTFSISFVTNLSTPERTSCSIQVLFFTWTILAGIILLYIIVTFGILRIGEGWTIFLFLTVAVVALLNVLASAIIAFSTHRNLFALKLVGRFGVREVLVSQDENYIHNIAALIRAALEKKSDTGYPNG